MRTSSMELKSGDLFRCFKGNLYQVITVALHTVNKEELVIFQALYGDYKVYAEPKAFFFHEVDCKEYPKVMQKFRFEPVLREELSGIGVQDRPLVLKDTLEHEDAITEKSSSINKDNSKQDIGMVDRYLMEFLDAESYQGKLDLLAVIRKHLNERAVSGIEISLDMTGYNGTLEERIDSVKRNLETRIKFEGSRLR